MPYASYVENCAKVLMKDGTDTYGEVHTPVLVSILDVETRACPENPGKLDESFRVIRRGRRSPAGSNLLTDQPTLRTLHALSSITGKRDYADFADRYAGYVMENLVDEQGFFWWGWHRHYDVFRDSREGHNPNRAKWGGKVIPHEIHAMNGIAWDRLWAIDKEAVTKEIEAMDGVGYLLYALLELDQILANPETVVKAKAIQIERTKQKMALDNW